MTPDTLTDLAPRWRRLLLFVFGAACTVVVLAGVRSVAGLLNPVLLAGFLALLLQPLLTRLRPLRGAAVADVVLVVILGGLALTGFIAASLRRLALQLPQYQDQLQGLLASVTRALASRGIDAAAYIESTVTGPAVARTLLGASRAVAGAFGDLVVTLFVFAFMLGGLWELEHRAGSQARDDSRLAARFLEFSRTLRAYTGVRSVLGLAAAVLNYLLLLLIGVDHAPLWAVLSFLLSFVPNIGFLLSLLPPMLLALLGKGWVSGAMVLVGYQVINTVLDNVIGPRLMARQMKISPLLSFLSVLFWAWVLGPTGAILAVPLTVLLQDLAFTPADRPDLGRPEPVTPSAVATP